MMRIQQIKITFLCVKVFIISVSLCLAANDNCFCQLKGDIDDCSCTVESVDSFNNLKIQPRLEKLLHRDYFKYYRTNLFKPCPFTSQPSGQCGSRSCAVDECKDEQIPLGLKKNHNHSALKNKYSKEAQQENACDHDKEKDGGLGTIDAHISKESQEAFDTWKKHDDAQDNFCELEDEDSPGAAYYDLVRNPERFTGYTGASAVNVWKLIYDQNCFKPDHSDYTSYLSGDKGLCLEKRVFFRMISGFHTSINVDVVANWLLPANNGWGQGTWGPNVEEFRKRFDPVLTYGEGPQRLKNLYFTYLVELRALAKVLPYLKEELFYTGNAEEDEQVRTAVADLLSVIKSFPAHFDESKLFQGNRKKLKDDFKVHFRNISRIMDCVGCDKCRLWGKLQIVGMGTAMKILFSGDSMGPESTVTRDHKWSDIPFQLTRGEIVALFNSLGRLSKSIHELENFRQLLTA